jgi:hypothetical protein
MKRILLNSALVLFSFLQMVSAQQIQGGCDKVTFVTFPSFPSVLVPGLGGYLAICDEVDPCSSLFTGDYCCRISFGPIQGLLPSLRLQKKDAQGAFVTVKQVAGNMGYVFSDLPKGVYRVQVRLPEMNLSLCCGKPVKIFDSSGRDIGWLGRLSPNWITSNEVLVGPASQSDINAILVDPNNNNAFDLGQVVEFDATNSTHYDQWRIDIAETGPVFNNRWATTGWQIGTQANVQQIHDIWGGIHGSFAPWHLYQINFVIENQRCVNGHEFPAESWNNKMYSFLICPEGTGCKIRKDDIQFTLAPNPASNWVKFMDIDDIWQEGFSFTIQDLHGRALLDTPILSDEIDVSHIPSGTYICTIHRNGEVFANKKLIIQK